MGADADRDEQLEHESGREIASILIQENKFGVLKETLARLISRHTATSELLLWLAKERSDTFADILGPEVFPRDADGHRSRPVQRKEVQPVSTTTSSTTNNSWVELIGSADFEVIKDLTRSLQLSPCFDDMDKRSLLARIVKSYPAVQSLISGEQTKQDNTLPRFPGKAWKNGRTNTPIWCRKDPGQFQGNRRPLAATGIFVKITNTRRPKRCKRFSCAARVNSKPSSSGRAARTSPMPAPTSQHRQPRPSDRPRLRYRRELHHSRSLGHGARKRHRQLPHSAGPGAHRKKLGEETEFEMDGVKNASASTASRPCRQPQRPHPLLKKRPSEAFRSLPPGSVPPLRSRGHARSARLGSARLWT